MSEIVKKAYAKINLHLDVTGIRDDGYHSVNNVMQSISLCDTVTVSERTDGEYSVSCTNSGVPAGADNLAVRAAAAFSKATKIKNGVNIEIEKNIPMAAGLAGGSADAAATLLGMNELFGSPLTVEELCRFGGMLGADIPFCICGGTAFADGKGEILHPFPPLPDCTLVVACGGEGVSTPQAFGMLDGLYNKFVSELFYTPRSLSLLKAAAENGNISEVASNMYNIFEKPILAVRPVAANLRRIMLSSGALGAMMSGSGPSVFGIFDSTAAAESACETIKKIGVVPHICKPII